MTPEFSRPERLDAIGEQPRDVAIEAGAEERRRLAARFGLVAVERLAARFTIRRTAAGILADGRVEAAVVQACAVTGDPLPAEVDETYREKRNDPQATWPGRHAARPERGRLGLHGRLWL